MTLKGQSIIEAQQFDRDLLGDVFSRAVEMETVVKKGGANILSNKRMVLFFYEPSTRTRLSFAMAMDFLGGRVVFSTENAREFSSVAKGESIEDTVRVLSGYHPDVIVIRSDQEGMAKRAMEYSRVPIISAGDGSRQHVTQAVLDIYTVWKERGEVVGLTIAMCGDLGRGRTVRSLSYLLAKFPGVEIYFVSLENLRMHDDIKEYLMRHNVKFTETNDLREVAPKVDVIYQTRIQKERGSLALRYGNERGFFAVNREVLRLMKKDAIIMHPLPRNDELSPEVDSDPRAAHFRQAENGLYVRMALLEMILA
jgi:aspartate carbamoyltransferase catalytic subunit